MKNILVIIGVLIIGSSCQEMTLIKEENINTSLNYFDIYDILNTPVDGTFEVQYSAQYPTQNSMQNTAKIDGHIKEDGGVGLLNMGTVKFGGFDMNPDNNNIYSIFNNTDCTTLYGTEVEVKIKENTQNFYLSQPIKFTNLEGNKEVYPGYTLKWNKDDKNSIGVLINLLYLTSDAYNKPFMEQGFDKSKNNYIITDDTGEYTFKESDFEKIPSGASISIGMMRGGAAIMTTNDNKKIKLAGLTSNSAPFIKVKY